MDFNLAFISLILLMNIEDALTLKRLHVICEHKNICALSETEVTMSCSYEPMSFKTVFWFSLKQSQNWREMDEPEDLSLDSDYSGRMNQRITERQSDLIIRDVRERDSGEYQLMFIMKDGVKHISSVSVKLTVTVLQVRIQQTYLRNQRVDLICETACTLTSRLQNVYWKKDGQYMPNINSRSIYVSSSESAAYSCVTLDLKVSSAPVCLSDRCWDVTYTSRRVCASTVGSTVDIHSSYSHPTGYTVLNKYWHSYLDRFRDLREKQRFAGRVEYVENTLRIKDVNTSDSGEYQYRIITETSVGNFFSFPGVILTVTDTQVISSPSVVSNGEKVILSCSTKCTMNNNIRFLWLKNGRPVTDGFKLFNKLYLNSVNNEELKQYSCTVEVESLVSVHSDFLIFLIVFVVQVLIIGAVWVWFFLKKSFLCKKQINDRNEEILMSHVSACTSVVSPTELVT